MIWGSIQKDHKTREPNSPKFYSAYSIIDQLKGFKQVFVTWYCSRRGSNSESYSQLIAQYDRLPAQYKRRAELYVDTLFRQPEIALLQQSVKKSFGVAIHTIVQSLPMTADSYLNFVHPEIMVDHKHVGILSVAPEALPPVSLKARGVYDLRHCQLAI
jgi:hypothetical protein